MSQPWPAHVFLLQRSIFDAFVSKCHHSVTLTVVPLPDLMLTLIKNPVRLGKSRADVQVVHAPQSLVLPWNVYVWASLVYYQTTRCVCINTHYVTLG